MACHHVLFFSIPADFPVSELCICADAVRRLHPGATDSEVKEVVTTWLTGSRDRDNGKREREETKRARQTEDRV